MRYKRNPSDWQLYDQETASLRERLRAAQEALNGYGVNTKGDPRFQGIRPDAGWANKDLRPAVESVEQDVKFYADFFQRRNPGVPAQRAGRSSLTGTVFRVTSYGSGGEIEPFPDEADRKDFKREGEARYYARAMATKYGAAVPIIRYLFSKSGSVLDRAHWTSEYPARKKNPRRCGKSSVMRRAW